MTGVGPRIVADGPSAREEAVALLRAGRIVAVPTDTVYGIAADLALPDAIERLFAAKRRPPDKAVALLLADAGQAETLGIVGPAARWLADRFWPGGLTLVLRRRPGVRLPDALAAGPTIGVRVPDHAAPRALAAALGPLPTTSANVSGGPDARDAGEVAAALGDAVALVLDGGPIRGGPASTVVDCSTERPVILRAGAIPPAEIAAALDAAGIAHDIETSGGLPRPPDGPRDVGR